MTWTIDSALATLNRNGLYVDERRGRCISNPGKRLLGAIDFLKRHQIYVNIINKVN